MNRTQILLALACAGLLVQSTQAATAPLEKTFQNPTYQGAPADSQIGVFWFWANSVTREGIKRDLEAMQRAGVRRVVLSMTKAHSATVEPGGVVFLSPEWKALFRYALDEAERLGLKVSVPMSNGWYQGAPWVTPELGAQMLAWSETGVTGPATFTKALPEPDKFRKGKKAGLSHQAKGHFKPIAVLAFRQNENGELLKDSLVRLDDRLQPDGKLNWAAPDGKWRVFRFMYVPNFVPMKQDSPGFTGLQIDHLSAAAMEMFFNQVGVPMLEAAGPHVGKTFDYLHEDSVELGTFNWTGDFAAQFEKRRKYDLIPWLPVLAGKNFANEPQAGRIEDDFVATVDEVFADEHYGTFQKLCHQHGIKLETEGGDVHSSLRLKGKTDLPMGEFWNARPKKSNLLLAFNLNAVFAAHVYGAGRTSFESFTTAQHWMEHPAMLKPMADEVFCLGVNHLTLHGYSYSRPETPAPGDVYFAGTHFNPGNNWWPYAGGFFTYLNRCQAMLNAGKPVVDVLYVDGPEVQELIQTNEARAMTVLGKFDAIPGDLLTAQLNVLPGGRVGLPHGMSYPVLAMVNETIEPDVLQKIVQLVNQGATLWLRAVPKRAPGWKGGAAADKALARCLKELGADMPVGAHSVGKGKVILGEMPVKDMLARLELAPAFAYTSDDGEPCLDYNQRQDGGTEIYFVANWKEAWHRAECAFRVDNREPELWNPVTGRISPCPKFQVGDGVVRVPLELPPNGSTFVVFRQKAGPGHGAPFVTIGKPVKPDGNEGTVAAALNGPWHVRFTPARPGEPPFELTSPALFLWNESPDARLKSFAGSASYQTSLVVDAKSRKQNSQWNLELGVVHDLAEVLVNGKSAGVVWTAPFRVDVAPFLQPGTNTLEVRVVNTWHNWRVVNKFSPLEHKWNSQAVKELLPAGLVGPVTLRMTDGLSAP